MSYYPTPGAPYVPQQPVNPYGGMGTVGLSTPLPNTQMQQAVADAQKEFQEKSANMSDQEKSDYYQQTQQRLQQKQPRP